MISTSINVFQETLKGLPELIYFSWTILPAPSRSSSRWSMIRTWVKIYLIGFREDPTPSKLIKVRISSGMYKNLISRTIRTAGVPAVDPSSLSWFKYTSPAFNKHQLALFLSSMCFGVQSLLCKLFMYERIMHCIHLFLLKRRVSRGDNVMYNIFTSWCFPVLSGFISVGPGGLKRKGGSSFVQGRGASLHSNLYRVLSQHHSTLHCMLRPRMQ